MIALLALVASECGPPRCTEPLTTGATFDAVLSIASRTYRSATMVVADVAGTAPAEPKNTKKRQQRFSGLDGARLVASVHIVLGHGYQQGAFRGVYFFAWGYTWVPWFFMLSGFVLAHVQLYSKAVECGRHDGAALARQ